MSTPQEEHAKRMKARTWPFRFPTPPPAVGTKALLRAPGSGYATGSEPPGAESSESIEAVPSEITPPDSWLPDEVRHPEPDGSGRSNGQLPPDLSRHSRKCSVCSHPDRDVIEAEFIRWSNPDDLVTYFNLGGRSAIYRHAHATGLFARRKRELCRTLETILETSDSATFETAPVLISAARIYSHLDEEGRWYEPPKTIRILHGQIPPAELEPPSMTQRNTEPPASNTQREAVPGENQLLIETPQQLEIAITP